MLLSLYRYALVAENISITRHYTSAGSISFKEYAPPKIKATEELAKRNHEDVVFLSSDS